MHIISLALGGCLRAEPVRYGITEDTGGHIAYILGEMEALAARDDVDCAEIVTRLFDAPHLGAIHAKFEEWLSPKLVIRRIDSGNRAYLAKEALGHDRAAFTRAFLADLRARDRLPDLIHAHFADAADVAAVVERELGIPFLYTAHSLGADKRDALDEANPALEARMAEENRAIARAGGVIGSSRDECERQLANYPSAVEGRIERIVPGTRRAAASPKDVEAARELIAPFLRHPDRPIVLAIARPVAKKNLTGLIEAFGAHPMLRDQANLVVLAGQRNGLIDHDETDQSRVLGDLADAIDRHDLYGSVAYPRRHQRHHVDGIYALAAQSGGVFVNPALMEPYGLTLVEAAAHGLPVVATSCGGPRDIVDELGHGTLVDPTSPDAIGKAIHAMLADDVAWRRYSAAGLRNAERMSWDRYAEGFMCVARKVLHRTEPVAWRAPARLVVSDLDNTLTGCPAGADRFARFVQRNRDFGFAVATGRSIIEARRLVREWNLPTPLAWITSVGSEIHHETDAGLAFDEEYAARIGHGWDSAAVEDALAGIAGLVPQANYDQRLFKRSYHAASPQLAGVVEAALRAAGVPAHIVFSHGSLLDVLPRNAGKGAAMHHLARRFGLSPADTFAIGDSGNDLDMLTACENAILVANHSAEVAALGGRRGVYVSRRAHGAGALEGVLAHHRSRTSQGARRILAEAGA